MRKVGYLRVSTDEQSLDRQIDGLKPVCDELYIETLSATSKSRPYYERAMRRLRRGDVLVVWDVDRAYRCAREALNALDALERRGVHLLVLNFPVDTRTPEGYFTLLVMLGAAEYERRILSRRTREGLAAARARGKRLGRPRKLTDRQVAEARRRLVAAGSSATVVGLAREYKVGRATLTRELSRLGIASQGL